MLAKIFISCDDWRAQSKTPFLAGLLGFFNILAPGAEFCFYKFFFFFFCVKLIKTV